MAKLKVAELFYSIQGEGRYMGVPSVFLRTFGCNFKCEGFGMPKGQKSEEYLNVDPEKYQSYNLLPLVSTGCDSYASWDPRFKHLSPVLDTDSVADAIVDTLPYKGWKDEHLVITGGEPLLGWQRAYPDLLEHPKMKALKEITFETNGTQDLSVEFFDYLDRWGWGHPGNFDRQLTFSVSPKLSVSGETWDDAIKPEIVARYGNVGYVYLKFVVASQEDADEAEKAVEAYRDAGFMGPVYLMPVGGVESVYHLNNRAVAELAMKKGYRYSDRLQVPLFKNEWGT
ncbi:NrdG Organic radical activating enzymes [uncultured Caudovirales phage]|uniref:NrdG Organic radical activating enzymes n=1 Tax=uncultured Caudovirales phage TaxID=2100421 RepID=A0A6J7WYH8_9CAUD|nr:NrdG Organic radical activating enzymes [uncultured Caudovirales phage]